MITRTWPYGVKQCEVKHVERSANTVILVAKADDEPADEAHLGVYSAHEVPATVKPGDRGEIVFTQGGPTGGHWKFRVEQA